MLISNLLSVVLALSSLAQERVPPEFLGFQLGVTRAEYIEHCRSLGGRTSGGTYLMCQGSPQLVSQHMLTGSQPVRLQVIPVALINANNRVQALALNYSCQGLTGTGAPETFSLADNVCVYMMEWWQYSGVRTFGGRWQWALENEHAGRCRAPERIVNAFNLAATDRGEPRMRQLERYGPTLRCLEETPGARVAILSGNGRHTINLVLSHAEPETRSSPHSRYSFEVHWELLRAR